MDIERRRAMTSIVQADPSALTTPTTEKRAQGAPASSKKKKRSKGKSVPFAMSMTGIPAERNDSNSRHDSPAPKRRRAHYTPIHGGIDQTSQLALDPSWQTIIAFRTSFGKGFQRVLDG